MARMSGFGWYEKIGRRKIEFATDTEARDGKEEYEDDNTYGYSCSSFDCNSHKERRRRR